jgi:RNA recognition motif-containing protein
MIKKSQLLKYFSDFGKVEKIISKFDQSNIAKGYCFVKFVSSESA